MFKIRETIKEEILLYIVLFIALAMVVTLVVLNTAKTYVAELYLPDGDYSEVRIKTKGDGDGGVTKLKQDGRLYTLLLENGKKGSFSVIIECVHAEAPSIIDSVHYGAKVTGNGLIFAGPDSDFNGHQVVPAALAFFQLFICIRMYLRYRKFREPLPYSYNALIRLSLAIYFLLNGLLFAGLSISGIIFAPKLTAYMTFLISGLAMSLVVLAMIPFIIIFAVIMVFSNLALIRHESFRFANILGFILSGLMLMGSGLILVSVVINPTYLSLTSVERAIEIARSILSPIFVYFICLLVATEVRMFEVARYKPSYDQDFIIILGCRIRDDGSLYPLIKGRADRAVAFYKEQVAATGKKAVFVPSGGQGPDEVMPEGEAIKNYLISIGIDSEQIMAETESGNTHENMMFSKKLIDAKKKKAKVLYSTTNYHIFRGGMIAYSKGLKARGIGSRTKWYYSPNAQIREFIGMLANKWKVHVSICLVLAATATLMALAPELID